MQTRWLALVALLSGCGDDGPSIALEDLHTEELSARCDYLVRCGLFAGGETCATFFRTPDERALAAAVEAGKIRYDGRAAAECQTALAALSCDQTSREARVVPSCERVFTGRVSDGEACSFDGECASGRCDEAVCPRDTCCAGACLATQQRSPIDAPCETDAGCEVDAYCGKDQRCHTLAKVGELCARDTECDYGLGCIGASDLMPGNCRALSHLGEKCPYLRCAEVGAFCDSTKTCVPVGLPGAPCASAAECSIYATCDLTANRCVDIPRLGEPCIDFCAGESWCNLMTGLCVAPIENGSLCTSDNQCASLLCHDGVAFNECLDRPICL